ncbi:hypothetical protein FHG87_013020 [Trinorchestia longiramus]|nr:hypothetical protein FHG87_013020 [Trinorchestia longiramus]
MDDPVPYTQRENARDSRFAGYEKGVKKSSDITEQQLKELLSENSVEDLVKLNGKSTQSLELPSKEFSNSGCNNFEEASVNELNTFLNSGGSNVDKRIEENDISFNTFDDIPRRLSESLEFSMADSSSSVRRERLHSSSENEEDLLEVNKDLPKIHSFGSPGVDPLESIQACNFLVECNPKETIREGTVPLIFGSPNEHFTLDGAENLTQMCTGTSEAHFADVEKDSEGDNLVQNYPMLDSGSGVTSYKNAVGLANDGTPLITTSTYEHASIPSPDGNNLPNKQLPIEVSSSPFFEEDSLGSELIVERKSPALVHSTAHTRIHPVISIEITAPAESVEENFRRDSSDGNLDVTETDFLSNNPNSFDRDSARGEVLSSSSSSHLSEGISFSTLSADENHSDIDKFVSKTRSRSFGEIEGTSNWRSSTNSVFGDNVDNPQYDSDVSANSSSASRPVSPSDSRLFSKVHAKVKNKRKRAAQYFKSGNAHRRNSDSVVVHEQNKGVFLEVPGESSDFHQTIMETNLLHSSDLSKSDSRLNEKQKSSKKRRLSESRMIVKLKGLKNKKFHHSSNPSLSTPQEVTLSPDPFADDLRTVRIKDGLLTPREVNFQHSPSYYENIKISPPTSRSRSPTPVMRDKKKTNADLPLADIPVNDDYGTVESIYMSNHSAPARKPFFSLEALRNVFRGKSRSVDHTSLASTFPIDNLRRSGSSHSSAAAPPHNLLDFSHSSYVHVQLRGYLPDSHLLIVYIF